MTALVLPFSVCLTQLETKFSNCQKYLKVRMFAMLCSLDVKLWDPLVFDVLGVGHEMMYKSRITFRIYLCIYFVE